MVTRQHHPTALIESGHSRSSRQQSGFTIVELMVATLAFSLILVVIIYSVLHFTAGYYKAINSSTTQNTVRDIASRVTQAIQFSDSNSSIINNPGSNSGYACVGDEEFAYNLGQQLSAVPYALHVFQPGSTACVPVTPTVIASSTWGSGQELLGPHMRLVTFDITNNPANSKLYAIDIRVAYGDNGLLCVPGVSPGGCNSNTVLAKFTSPNITCKPQTGSQFCYVSSLLSIVQRRLN